MTRLDEIPTAFAPPAGARPSEVVARIRTVRPSRRTVLRGLVIGAAAAALVPLDWYLSWRGAAAQESDDRSEYQGCAPESYDEEADNWPAAGAATCYGGWRRGSYPCSGGYHREGDFTDDGETLYSTRLTTGCHGRNAWRWNGYRCSDAMTTATFDDGTEYNGVTIAACQLEGQEGAAPDPDDSEPEGGATDDSGSDSTGDGGGAEGSADPARPRRVVPDLNTGLSSLPGIGSMAGR